MSLPPVARGSSRLGRGTRGSKPQREPESPPWSGVPARQRVTSSNRSSSSSSSSSSSYRGGGSGSEPSSSSSSPYTAGKGRITAPITSPSRHVGGARSTAGAAAGGTAGSRQLKAPKKEVPVRNDFIY